MSLNNKRTLSEGALHIMHPYEDTSLKLSELKQIFQQSVFGGLEYTEKTDGQSCYFHFDPIKRQTFAAYNAGHMKKGGLSREEFHQWAEQINPKTKQKKPEVVRESYKRAFDVFDKAVKSLNMNEEYLKDVFFESNNQKVFLATEIISTTTPNVINYDRNHLVIHRANHRSWDAFENKFEELEESDFPEGALQRLEDQLEKSKNKEYPLVVNAVKRLADSTLEPAYEKIASFLSRQFSNYGLGDSDSLADFVQRRCEEAIVKQFSFDAEVASELAGVFTSIASPYTNASKVLQRDIKPLIEKVKNDKDLEESGKSMTLTQLDRIYREPTLAKSIIKKAIWPIELAVHEFATDVLKDMKSAFIIDNKKAAQDLTQKLTTMVNALNSAKDAYKEIVPVLDMQLEKFGDQIKMSTPVEGIVFSFNGSVYKYTGSFAPLNQLSGLFKFGRKGVKLKGSEYDIDLSKQMNLFEQLEEKAAVNFMLLPGGFKPPHVGHLSLIQTALKNYPNLNLRVLSGKNVRAKKQQIPVGWEQAEEVFRIMLDSVGISIGQSPGEVFLDYIDEYDTGRQNKVGNPIMSTSPIGKIKAIIETEIVPELKENEVAKVNIICSEADSSYAKVFKSLIEKELRTKVEVIDLVFSSRRQESDVKFSASTIRSILVSDEAKPEDIRDFYPPSVSDANLQKIFSVLKGIDDIQEVSSMAGGAVAGHMGHHNKGKKMKELSLIRNESILRKKLRRFLRAKNSLILQEEAKLRNMVKKILVLEKKQNKIKHRLTSINKLDEFFANHKAIIEDFYTTLTSSPQQRESFRKHLFNAMINSFQIQDSLDSIENFLAQKTKEKGGLASVPQSEEKPESMEVEDFEDIEEPEELKEETDLKVAIGKDGTLEKEPDDEEKELEKELEKEKAEEDVADFPEEERLEGLDPMGRQAANDLFGRISAEMTRYREMPYGDEEFPLDPNDPDTEYLTEKEIFTYYLFLNLQLFFELIEEKEFGEPGEEVDQIESERDKFEKQPMKDVNFKDEPEAPEEDMDFPEEEPEAPEGER